MSLAKPKTILLMAGGTGGHIFPALAVAQSLRERGHQVVWLGSENSMEARLVPQYEIELHTVAMKGLRGNGLKRKLAMPMMVYKAVQSVKKLLRERKIDAVVGFGGFVTFPGGLAAKLSGIPIVVHEQNAVAGMANKQLAKWAARLLYAFPEAFPNADKTGWVGNPVRADIAALPEPQTRFAERSGSLNMTVIGGSLGARAFNELLPQALSLLPENQCPNVIHQTGRGNLAAVQADYAQRGLAVQCVEFIDDMTAVYRDSDILLCRAGALTVAELAAAGLGALLVPFPHAVDDHQTANARYFVATQAGLLLPQAQLQPENLADILAQLTREQCQQWAQNARTLAMPDSADKVADAVLQVVGN